MNCEGSARLGIPLDDGGLLGGLQIVIREHCTTTTHQTRPRARLYLRLDTR
jgi:hypothetical protein